MGKVVLVVFADGNDLQNTLQELSSVCRLRFRTYTFPPVDSFHSGV